MEAEQGKGGTRRGHMYPCPQLRRFFLSLSQPSFSFLLENPLSIKIGEGQTPKVRPQLPSLL